MSEPRSSLPAGSYAAISAATPAGMVTLKADLTETAVATALAQVAGLSVPAVRRVVTGDDHAALWFAPDELLITTPDAPALVTDLGAALAGVHHLVADVSDARLRFLVEGPGAAEVLARGAPVDFSESAFGPGDLRRSRLGQLAIAIWCMAPQRYCVFCHRSVGQHVGLWLDTAAASGPAGLYCRT